MAEPFQSADKAIISEPLRLPPIAPQKTEVTNRNSGMRPLDPI